MTAEEAIKHLKLIVDNEAYTDYFQDVCRKAVEALEKQVAKKPLERKVFYGTEYRCPNCKNYVGSYNVALGRFSMKDKICDKCGQAIDWSEV